MSIHVTSVFVDDQSRALTFYTDKLGFEKKNDIPMGPARWLTLVSPAARDGVELLLELDTHPVAKQYKEGLMADGIPAASFSVDDIHAEHTCLTGLGVKFTQPPTLMEPFTTAVLDDTCGNLIQLTQLP
ncbi:VOC family protein [Streptomyces abikoensis]|uniref:VOC family protein n=1 Tax=Streptomyces abikoensis TaxID=97398 RepID=A0ABW7T899_9ACTN